jgi:nitrite reductase (NO-forming)
MVVNGKKYDSAMPPQEAVLTDAQIADVLTYITNTWGNKGDAFTTDQVKALRSQTQ